MNGEFPKPGPVADKMIGCLLLAAVVGLTVLLLGAIFSFIR
jgi:hypothetical protein